MIGFGSTFISAAVMLDMSILEIRRSGRYKLEYIAIIRSWRSTCVSCVFVFNSRFCVWIHSVVFHMRFASISAKGQEIRSLGYHLALSCDTTGSRCHDRQGSDPEKPKLNPTMLWRFWYFFSSPS